MPGDDADARRVMRRSMIGRIATVSPGGRPRITPLYFVLRGDHVWLGTVDWTRAVRNVEADARVSVLFQLERDAGERVAVRVKGRATVRRDAAAQRAYRLRVARKYVLTPGGIFDTLTHLRQMSLVRRYRAASAARGASCVIDVVPEAVDLLGS